MIGNYRFIKTAPLIWHLDTKFYSMVTMEHYLFTASEKYPEHKVYYDTVTEPMDDFSDEPHSYAVYIQFENEAEESEFILRESAQ